LARARPASLAQHRLAGELPLDPVLLVGPAALTHDGAVVLEGAAGHDARGEVVLAHLDVGDAAVEEQGVGDGLLIALGIRGIAEILDARDGDFPVEGVGIEGVLLAGDQGDQEQGQ
jgi:hypothetical protein